MRPQLACLPAGIHLVDRPNGMPWLVCLSAPPGGVQGWLHTELWYQIRYCLLCGCFETWSVCLCTSG